jgi:glutaredoxin 3
MENLIKSAEIVVFSSEYCPYCSDAIASLKSAGYDKIMKVIEADSSHKSQLFSITKQRTVPQIFINGTFVGGCNDGPEPWMGIKKLLSNGKIKDYLSK